MSHNDTDKERLLKRIEYLEGVNSWYMFSLDLLSQMGNIFGDEEKVKDVGLILETARLYINRLFAFDASAFYLIDDDDANFNLSICEPPSYKLEIKNKVDELIEAGEFAWVLNQNKAAHFTLDPQRKLLLHVLTSKANLYGMFVGVLHNDKVNALSDSPFSLLTFVLQYTSYALESSALYRKINEQNHTLEEAVEARTKELEYQHAHDALTGLPNRFVFVDRLQQAIERAKRNDELVGVLVLDLDMFKMINDTLGHQLGDELLKEVAKRYHDCLRTSDTLTYIRVDDNVNVSRIGGDEFSIMLPSLRGTNDVINVVHRIIKALQMPFYVQDEEIFVTTSIGVSFFPHDGQDADTLLKHADAAMFDAKRLGRNTYQFYSTDVNEKSLQYLHLGSQLRQGLSRNQFILHYQPQIDIRTNRVVAVEALIRWVLDDNTMVPPDMFIPIAEESGLIIPIGEWVIEEAAKQIQQLCKHGFKDIRVAVNLSAKQFHQKELVKRILSIIDQYSILPDKIELEITEGMIIQDISETISTLHAMHNCGFTVAIDDFGSGYSSLNYLKEFTLDVLKIDRSFINDVLTDHDDAAIVRTIITLAHNLGLLVTAEGVESKEQVEFLKESNCEIVQGYYFSKPLSSNDLLNYLKMERQSCS